MVKGRQGYTGNGNTLPFGKEQYLHLFCVYKLILIKGDQFF